MKQLTIPLCCVTAFLVCSSLSAEDVRIDSIIHNRGLFDSPERIIAECVPGVRVACTDGNTSSALELTLRGFNSIYSTSEPLWIVDGVELSSPFGEQINAYWRDEYSDYSFMSRLSQLDFLNIYDIESIQVLKNISETSRYGSRGANGVILINTRTGAGDRASFRWDSDLGFDGGFKHNHSASASYSANNASMFVSAFYRDHQGAYKGSGSRFGGVRLKYDTRTNKFIWMGMSFNVAAGRQESLYASSAFGTPSFGIALRGTEITGCINSVEGWEKDYNDYNNVFRIDGSAYFQVNILPTLRWRTDFGIDSNNSTRYFWNGLGTEMGTRFNRTSAIAVATLMDFNLTSKLQFEKRFAQKNHILIEAGAGLREDGGNYSNFDGQGYFTDILREKGFSLRESAFPAYRVRRTIRSLAFNSALHYDYDGIAGLDVSISCDKNSRYDDGYASYPSVNLFLNLKKAFLEDNGFVSDLRLDGGWGRAGSSRFAPWHLMGNYLSKPFAESELLAQGIEIDENVPEKNIASSFDIFTRALTTEFHAGLTSAFISNRVRFGVEFYERNTVETLTLYGFSKKSETIIWKPSPRYGIFDDSSSFSNSGVEFTLEGTPLKSKGRILTLRAAGAFNRSEVVSVGNGLDENLAGKPLGAILDGEGVLLGCSQPDFSGSFTADLKIGRFGTDLSFNGCFGAGICDMNRMLEDGQTAIFADYVMKADCLRLGRLEAYYEFPMSRVKWIKGIELSVAAANLFTLSSYEGWNPEANSFGSLSNRMSGYDYGSLPLCRSFVIGVCAKF